MVQSLRVAPRLAAPSCYVLFGVAMAQEFHVDTLSLTQGLASVYWHCIHVSKAATNLNTVTNGRIKVEAAPTLETKQNMTLSWSIGNIMGRVDFGNVRAI